MKFITREGLQQPTADRSQTCPFLRAWRNALHKSRCMQNHTVEQIVAMFVSQIQEKLAEMIQFARTNLRTHHLLKSSTFSSSQVPEQTRAVDVPVTMQAKVPAVQVAQKTVEIPQAHMPNKVVHTPFCDTTPRVHGSESADDTWRVTVAVHR